MNDLPPVKPLSPQSTSEIAGAKRVQDPLARALALSGEVKDASESAADRDPDGHSLPGGDSRQPASDEDGKADPKDDKPPRLGVVIDVEA